MKKIMRCLALCGVLFATSCANENLTPNVEEAGNVTVNVNVGMESRTMIDDNGFNIWNEQGKETIFVISEDGNVYGTLNLVKGSLKEEGKNATFSGTVIGDPAQLKYAYYPAPEMVNGEWRIKMGQVEGKDHKAPMYGTITHAQDGSWSVNFKNAGALVRFQIDGVAGEDLGFTATMGDKNVTGGYYTLSGDGLKFNPAEEGGRTDVLGFPKDGIVYLPVGLVEGQESVEIEAVLHQDGGPRNLFTLTDIPVQRNYISTYSVPNFVVNLNAGTGEEMVSKSTEIVDLQALKNAFNNGGNYKLAASYTETTISETLTLESGKTLTLDLNRKKLTGTTNWSVKLIGVKSGAELTIKNGEIENVGPCLNSDGKVILDCTLISTGSNAIQSGYTSELTINGGRYESENNTGAALRMNAWAANDGAGAWKLYINGGTFVGKWTGLYMSQNYTNSSEGEAVIRDAIFKGDNGVKATSEEGKDVYGADIVFNIVKNVTIENCTFETKTMRSVSGEEKSVINNKTVETVENVYEYVFGTSK